jgi:hypothetical protein
MKTQYLIILFALIPFFAFSQEGNPFDDPKKKEEAQPLELQEYIIQGREVLNVKSGAKQSVGNIQPLSQAMLDSINSLEKKQALDLKYESPGNNVINTDYSRGYLTAGYGMFNTANAEASLGFDIKGYDIYLNTGIEVSDGDPKNADYSKIYAQAFSDYIAPEKFYIFGGSKTRTMIDVKGFDYNLYGYNYDFLPEEEHDFFNKKRYELKGSVDTEGSFESVMFNTGFAYETMQLIGDPVLGFDNSLSGYVKLKNYWENFLIAGNVSLDLRNASSNTINFTQIDGSLEYFNDNLTINANGGFQFAVNSLDIDRAGLLLQGELEFRFSSDFTFNAKVYSGLDKTTFTDLIQENPYFNQTPLIDHPYNIADVDAYVYFHPITDVGITAGINYKQVERMRNFQYDTLGSFQVLYLDGFMGSVNFDTYWNMSDRDKLTGNFEFNFSELADNANSATYLPNIKFGIKYYRDWFDKLNTSIGMIYVGERYGDIENNSKLESYMDLNFDVGYDLTQNFNIFLKMNNLLNQDIYIYENFQERSLFAKLGIMWKL